LVPGTTKVSLVERPEPFVSAPDELKLRIVRVGICGTDREEAAGGRALAPEGYKDLVIGHEMLGQVVQVGKEVKSAKPGDYAIFTDRRGCGRCRPCGMNRPDMCQTGDFRERGIWGLDGFQVEFAVDQEQYLVSVPAELEAIGVLAEPLSVAVKAIDEAVRIQQGRMPDGLATPNWLYGRRCLVAGLGPVGLLAAVALRLRGGQRRVEDARVRGHAEVAHHGDPGKAADFIALGNGVEECRRPSVMVGTRVGGVQKDVDIDAEAHSPSLSIASQSASRSARSTRAPMGLATQRNGRLGGRVSARFSANSTASRSETSRPSDLPSRFPIALSSLRMGSSMSTVVLMMLDDTPNRI